MDDLDALDLPALVGVTAASWAADALAHLAAVGHPRVRAAHGYVFQHLLLDPPTVGDLAERLGVSQQAASKSVRELEQLGYVVRRGDAADSRVRRVELTAAGHDVVVRDRERRAAVEAVLVERHGARAVATAKRVLGDLLIESGGIAAVTGRRVRPVD